MARRRTVDGEAIARIRDENFMSQAKLAEEAGVAESTIVRIERGQRQPHFETLLRIAKALDVDPEALRKKEDSVSDPLGHRPFPERLNRLFGATGTAELR